MASAWQTSLQRQMAALWRGMVDWRGLMAIAGPGKRAGEAAQPAGSKARPGEKGLKRGRKAGKPAPRAIREEAIPAKSQTMRKPVRKMTEMTKTRNI